MRKAMKENIKRHYAVSLLLAAYIIFHLLFFGIYIQNQEKPVNEVMYWLQPTVYSATVIVGLGIILAVSEFYYLHIKSRTDFYHVLPQKRKDLFWNKVKDSVQLFVTAHTILILSELFVTIVLEIYTMLSLKALIASYILGILMFIAVFFLATLAMLMTGNVGVGLLGIFIFSVWTTLVEVMIGKLSTAFLSTYVEMSTLIQNVCEYGSPVSLIFRIVKNPKSDLEVLWHLQPHVGELIGLCVWILLLGIVTQKVFEIRPSETAGNAMAFPKLNAVIMAGIVVPFGIMTGLYVNEIFINLSADRAIFAGAVIGTVLFYAFVEAIFELDIHRMFSHKKSLLVTMFLVLGIICSFRMDFCGYDRYRPTAEKVESISVDNNIFSAVMSDSLFNSPTLPEIKGEEKNQMMQILQEGIQSSDSDDILYSTEAYSYEYYSDDTFFNRIRNLFIYNIGTVFANIGADKEKIEDDDAHVFVFHLKNGQTKTRCYVLTKKAQQEMVKVVLNSDTYKKSLYSIYHMEWKDVSVFTWRYMNYAESVVLSKEDRNTFLNIYSKELQTLDADMMANVLPVGAFYIEFPSREYEGNTEVDCYYIYPSFKKSIAFLKEKGYDTSKKTLENYDIKSISVEAYDDEWNMEETIIDDPVLIAKVKGKLSPIEWTPGYYRSANGGDTSEKYTVTVSNGKSDSAEDNDVTVYADRETIKELLKENKGEK